jgi:acyl-CoA synthetase (AMP-forming)/AMP-acid ligase II
MVEDFVAAADLVQLLRRHAGNHADRVAIRLDERALTYSEVDRRAQAVAALLRSFTSVGDRVALLFPADPDFLPALFGCWYAGVIAVPVASPRALPQVSAAVVLTSEDVLTELGAQASAVLGRYATVEHATTAGPAGESDRARHEVAVLQHTSGTTGKPRGVVVSHQNYSHNVRMLTEFTRSIAPDVRDFRTVSWLPHFHDMGLALMLFTVAHAGTTTLIEPMAFLRDPGRWLRTIAAVGGNLTAAPNFAYDLCVRRVPGDEAATLDLSSMAIMLNGAEPVRAATMERFAAHFAASGFRASAFAPAYGLAEGTVFVSGLRFGGIPRTVRFDRRRLQDGFAAPGTAPLVGCGLRPDGLTVRIADPRTGAEVPPGTIGEIWVHGPSIALGYAHGSSATAFAARLTGFDHRNYLRTGDLGFLWDGELFVVGRLADLIMLDGRMIQPADLEYTVERSHPALEGRRCVVVAYGEDDARLAVAVEVRAEPPGLADVVRAAVAAEHDVEITDVLVLPIGALPVTTSGKVQRSRCREMLLAGGVAPR